MNPLYRLFPALALAALAALPAQAQDDRPARAAERGYARVGVGVNVAQPLLKLPGNNRPTSPWMGVHYRTNWIEMGYLAGSFNASGREQDPTARGTQVYLGGSFPIGAWGLGHRERGMRGMLLMPTLSAGGALVYMGPDKANQLYVAPGLSLQLPYVLIDLRAQSAYTFGKDDDEPGVQLGGFAFQPQLTLQFDGLWDVFAPKRSYDGHASGTNTYTNKTLVSSSSTHDTYRVTTTTTPYDFDMYITGGDAFSAIVPRATTSFASDSHGRTLMGGLGISGRASAFSYDAFAEYGQLGVNGAWSVAPQVGGDEAPRKGEPNTAETRFGGSRPAGRVLVRGGVDLIFLLQSMAFHSNGGGEGATKFVRIIGGWGPGYSMVNGPLTFSHPEQEAALDQQFASQPGPRGTRIPSQLAQNEFSDPRRGRAGYCHQWYAQLEVGVASISVEANRYRNNPLANANSITLSYLFPYSLLKKSRRN